MTTLFEKDKKKLSDEKVKSIIEGILFVSKKPVSIKEIRNLFSEQIRLRESQIAAIIEELKIDYVQRSKGFRIVEIAGGYQLRTPAEFAPYIVKLLKRSRDERLSQPALETLAIIAYRQPIVKSEIETIRGVDVSGVIKTLHERGLIRITGRKEVPGRPFIYGTTQLFLEHFGLKRISDLPHLTELRSKAEGQRKLKF